MMISSTTPRLEKNWVVCRHTFNNATSDYLKKTYENENTSKYKENYENLVSIAKGKIFFVMGISLECEMFYITDKPRLPFSVTATTGYVPIKCFFWDNDVFHWNPHSRHDV